MFIILLYPKYVFFSMRAINKALDEAENENASYKKDKHHRGCHLQQTQWCLHGGPGWTRTNVGLTFAFTVRCHCR